MNNLRQMGICLNAYAAENDGVMIDNYHSAYEGAGGLPSYWYNGAKGFWWHVFARQAGITHTYAKYVGGATVREWRGAFQVCPDVPRARLQSWYGVSDPLSNQEILLAEQGWSYSFNIYIGSNFNPNSTFPNARSRQIGNFTGYVAMWCDWRAYVGYSWQGPGPTTSGLLPWGEGGTSGFSVEEFWRHGGGRSNWLWVDGHVERRAAISQSWAGQAWVPPGGWPNE